MKILHVVHYDSYLRSNETFIGRAQNGLERWLDSMILNSDASFEHYVLHLNFADDSISVQHILSNGENAEYTNFFDVAYTEANIRAVMDRILAWFAPQLIHIHYLQPYTKYLPRVLHELGFEHVIATMHDESFLGDNFGMDQQYVYDEDVADFFAHLQKVVFLHETSMQRYVDLYKDVLSTDKITKIGNGVSLEPVAYVSDEARPFTVLFLGSFIENKGSKIIAELDALNQEQAEKFNLYLLGRSLDEALAETSVTYLGPYKQTNIAERIAMLNPDVIVIASVVEETFSYTALEATALGYPLVTFAVGALNSIEDEGRGFVVQEKTATALFAGLQKLADVKATDKAAWFDIFERVRQSDNLSDQEMVRAYEAMYETVGAQEARALDTKRIFQHNLTNLKQREHRFVQAVQAYEDDLAQFRKREAADEELAALSTGQKKRSMLYKGTSYMRKHGGLLPAVSAFNMLIKRYGFKLVYEKVLHLNANLDYVQWIERSGQDLSAGLVDVVMNKLTYQPKISIVMPVYNVGEQYLRTCLDSVLAQSYPNWELCIADDASSEPHIKTVLDEYVQQDYRIKVVYREENGHISAATNSALALATGEFVAFMDNDDVIVRDAFLEVVKLLNEHPEADFIYSDEDKMNADGTQRVEPFFKPDWSPDSLWSHMYVTHLTVFRMSIAKAIGGLRVGYEGSQDYDFVLRFVEQTENIYHIPKVLYDWRMIETSAASGSENKNYAYDAGIKAKEDAVVRRGLDASIEPLPEVIGSNIIYAPGENDLVSIIITSTGVLQTEACLQSLYGRSSWQRFEVVVLTPALNEAETETFATLMEDYERLHVVTINESFNYSKWNNEGAQGAKGNVLLFMHDDIEFITEDWLERMLGQAIQPHTGVVGAKILNRDDTVQDVGIVISEERPVRPFGGLSTDSTTGVGYFGRPLLIYNYLAISSTMLMVERAIFTAVGGFDEDFVAVYNDVAFGMKVYERGHYNVTRGDVLVRHLATQPYNSNGTTNVSEEHVEAERQLLVQKMPQLMAHDPFFNPNLVVGGKYFAIKKAR